MDRVLERTPEGTSPRTFALNHQRPKRTYAGCSRIADYELLGKLGEGTFGEVHRARSRKSGSIVALKKIIMHHEKDGFPITALREIKLLKLLSHENVLRLEDMAVEHPTKATDKRKKPIMYMVMPYMDHDLSGLLENPSVHFKEGQIKCYLLQLLRGLSYLHDKNILHRDMKAANILINNQGLLQIADFGLARHYEGPPPVRGQNRGEGRRDYTSLVVTRWYRPPELLLQLKQYTTAVDVWGVGCIFAEMIVGKPILAGESDTHQLELIWDLMGSPTEENMPGWKLLPGGQGLTPRPRTGNLQNRFRDAGTGAISLLRELLRLDWKTRINAVDALEHPFFQMQPLPMKPHEIPTYEESHELDRRKFHDRKANLPPAPKGGTVGIGPDANGATAGFNSDGYVRNGGAPNNGRFRDDRRPPWPRDRGPPPSRPPPGARDDMDRAPRPRGLPPRGGDIDTYIPSYRGEDDGRRRDDRPRDDRRPRPPRDEYRRTRSRSRSPGLDRRDRERERVEVYRR
ncbi:Serine/threonine-protein kinase bur-1 [Emericellopsis atlantica]|uniref:Serine/threonine-protein kinase BUR1 n=1 Tax=Emericellopsis atlantica TaxID=2614577 RepID=A0A9P8CQF8_9HYPO|nr:Serine/threonine-protein kinase bur-1 [Emericellopsis atlantica]KAG9255267.1 Serine/threonine-protein kinase bur-1 [Emericellopsis atlantica]